MAVADKVRKLLSLANSSNEHEANAAAEQAHRLMLKHNLTAMDLEEPPSYSNDTIELRSRPIHMKFVACVLSKHFHVRLTTNAVGLRIFGTKENVEIAQYMYAFLSRTYQDLWKQYRIETGAGRGSMQAYYQGVTWGLLDKLEAQTKDVEQETGLVVVEDPELKNYVDKMVPHLRKVRKLRIRKDACATSSGMSDGSKIQLRHGVTTTTNHKQLG
jgi:hypothetical protein